MLHLFSKRPRFRPAGALAQMTGSFNDVSADAPRAALGSPRRRELAGEDAPLWLTTGFAVLGMVLALAVAALTSSKDDGGAERMPPAATAPAPPAEAVSQPREEAPLTSLLVPLQRGESEIAATLGNEAPETSRAAADCPPVLNVAFAPGSARPNVAGLEDAAQTLRAWLARNAEASLSLEGRTDSTGRERSNIVLSFMRARSVGRWLADLGIPERQMFVRGAGPSVSKGVSNTPDGDYRRVEVRIEGVPGCR